MKTTLNYDNQLLEKLGGINTACEIAQQPLIWQQLDDILLQQKTQLNDFLSPILASCNLQIILTGAGTSAYVGQTISAYLNALTPQAKTGNIQFCAIATTDIVSNPQAFLFAERPTLLVSFARSGNSPESIACVNLANQCIDNIHHLIITCNEQGALHLAATKPNQPNSFSLLMPKDSNDKSFAMTSSFTVMTMAALRVFGGIFGCKAPKSDIQACCKPILTNQSLQTIRAMAAMDFNKIVFIGSGPLAATAQEASLKMLELSKGLVNSYFETVLGFRHGPKSVVDDKTLVIILSSHQDYQRQYENDLFNELKADQQSPFVYTMSELLPNMPAKLQDVWLSFPYIVYCQVLAFYKALLLDITPDNPCPTGEVNRVVQGVSIYPYQPN